MDDEHLHLSIFFIFSVWIAVGLLNIVGRTIFLHMAQSRLPVVQAIAKAGTYTWG